MAARSAWAGVLTFVINGVPFPVHVAAYTVTTSRKSASFKMLDPKYKMPVSQKLVDTEGNEAARGDTLKGVEVTKGHYVALTDDALELIERLGASEQVEIERFAPVASIPFDLSLGALKFVPNPKVPGSEQPVNIIWNGLRESERAAVIPDWAPTASAYPSTLVIRATGDGLGGSVIPFGSELKSDLPTWVPVADEKAATLAAAAIAQGYCIDDFDISVYQDGKAQRREAAIALALSGEPVPAEVKASAAAPAAPDMMAMLEASLAAQKPEAVTA